MYTCIKYEIKSVYSIVLNKNKELFYKLKLTGLQYFCTPWQCVFLKTF